MTPTHKYPNGRPVTVGELCLADLDDSDTAPGRTLSRPAAGRVTRLLDDNQLEIAIVPNGYPVIANASRAVSLEDVKCLPYLAVASGLVSGSPTENSPAPQNPEIPALPPPADPVPAPALPQDPAPVALPPAEPATDFETPFRPPAPAPVVLPPLAGPASEANAFAPAVPE